mmetsp:Transcript_37/g.68  ORF Transcript_37/g.68 Transcript_37/m.68 type:complete len:318 (-) Transcript_37:922-1875(-)|eukprot:CAMPEP_0119103188 /NCGR_PEP_ID=MMETSP1180-20130426/1695_1 /TAXON_ID=3052 ORGANISM="Chlamydomonas cf sp, Strain CCMP681" /NCGR_SAMPLE_ID=MMETSP1180 /ASSEMBLY_ACC=CAM_ASM_000741 /LENGTH=317 /DNA_ID=CAMNT_0007087633 /DNA_START=82 /DNA_END=1035 /DNA_ORIENTATION=+
MSSLAESLRHSVLTKEKGKSDTQFLAGTAYNSHYTKPPLDAYVSWQPLPLCYEQQSLPGLAMHQTSTASIFPRVDSYPEEVKNKIFPRLNSIVEACKAIDTLNTGTVKDADLLLACQVSGVFISRTEADMLRTLVTRNPNNGGILWDKLTDLAGSGTATQGSTGITLGRPPLPSSIDWPSDQEFGVELRLRPNTQPFMFEADRMQEYARMATKACKGEVNAEIVHALIRTHLLQVLVIEPVRYGQPDLGFRNWLGSNSIIMTITARNKPGPIPPEVYDVLDQIIYDGLGIPRVHSATQTLTSLGASMRGSSNQHVKM